MKTKLILGICLALTFSIALAGTALAEDDEQVKVVKKKVIVHCDGDDCEEHGDHVEVDLESLHDAHAFAWVSGDGPGQMRFRTHVGGGYLGVQLAELTPELRTHFGVDAEAGVMISKVLDDSPAARAGLEVGDIVSAVDGEPVAHGQALAHAIRQKDEGQTVLLEVWRDGSVLKLSAAVEERKPMERAMDWSFVMDCDKGEDCSFARRKMIHGKHGGDADVLCESGDCEVMVRCEGESRADCECTVNGEATDCSGLPDFDE